MRCIYDGNNIGTKQVTIMKQETPISSHSRLKQRRKILWCNPTWLKKRKIRNSVVQSNMAANRNIDVIHK